VNECHASARATILVSAASVATTTASCCAGVVGFDVPELCSGVSSKVLGWRASTVSMGFTKPSCRALPAAALLR
jgi:hypothetical protein